MELFFVKGKRGIPPCHSARSEAGHGERSRLQHTGQLSTAHASHTLRELTPSSLPPGRPGTRAALRRKSTAERGQALINEEGPRTARAKYHQPVPPPASPARPNSRSPQGRRPAPPSPRSTAPPSPVAFLRRPRCARPGTPPALRAAAHLSQDGEERARPRPSPAAVARRHRASPEQGGGSGHPPAGRASLIPGGPRPEQPSPQRSSGARRQSSSPRRHLPGNRRHGAHARRAGRMGRAGIRGPGAPGGTGAARSAGGMVTEEEVHRTSEAVR